MTRRPINRRTSRNVPRRSINLLVGAGLVGAIAGVGTVATTPEGHDTIVATATDIGIAIGVARERSAKEGDYWSRCDDARAVGAAPIYRGEPGYREGLDADNDGIACEPYRGQ
jgi:hypothetical protein